MSFGILANTISYCHLIKSFLLQRKL
nr:unnamed protein product [Callosobruchus analis]